jgi:hypothetical protein
MNICKYYILLLVRLWIFFSIRRYYILLYRGFGIIALAQRITGKMCTALWCYICFVPLAGTTTEMYSHPITGLNWPREWVEV